MPITGEIQGLYRDREQTQPVFPLTKVKAISDDDGVGLNVLLDEMVYKGDAVGDASVQLRDADTLGGRLAADYATQSFVTNKIAEAQLGGGESGSVDLSGYATKDYVDDQLDNYAVTVDTTLSVAGQAADSKAVGVALATKAPLLNIGQYLGDLNSSTLDNTICWIQNTTTNNPTGTYGTCETWSAGNGGRLQRITCSLGIVQRIHTSSWGEWEWVNSPMTLGVEYRTTERYEGKPVYTKMVNTGSMTNGSQFIYAQDATRPIRCFVTVDNSLLPDYVDGALLGGNWSKWYDISGKTFKAYMGTNLTGIGYRLQVWYIK